MANYENFKRALSFVLGNEGGYSNDPLDRGGATNLGITQSTLDRARREGIGRLPQSVKDLKREQAEQQARELKGKVVIVKMRAGENGKLYGSVTNELIADAMLAQHGVEVDKRKIELEEPVKAVGQVLATVRLAAGVSTRMIVNIVAEEK